MSTITIIDRSNDESGQMYHRLCTAYGISSDFVKKASQQALAGDDETHRNLFADYAFRMFYVGNASAVKSSALYFYAQKEAMEADRSTSIERRLIEAAIHFGVKSEVESIARSVLSKQASHEIELPDEFFMLVWKSDGGEVTRKYPLRNPLECVKAADYLVANSKSFPFGDRCTMSTKLLRKMADLSVTVSDPIFDRLLRMAGQGTCSAKSAAEYVFQRAKMLKAVDADIQTQENLAKMAQSLLEDADHARLPSTLRKVAAITDAIDRRYNLQLDPPEDVLFLMNMKSAQRFKDNHVFLSSGAVYDSAEFSKLPLHMFRQAAGDTVADAMSTAGMYVNIHKASEVLSQVPVVVGERIEKAAAELGIQPAYRGSSAPLRLEQSVLRELSIAHAANPTGVPA